MKVIVCVGSSCHLRGAAGVIKKFKDLNSTGSKVFVEVEEMELEASFCQDRCNEGVIVSIDGEIFTRVTPENVPFLVEKLLKRNLGEEGSSK
jgi:NADH:ubiquinone oxidoreductase subunit E